ncbi:hypothetical protein IG631_11141 [Alternaria alternata]|nr:hypothetical protein IG631_11141 [Alternaria alternata]
MDQALGTSSQMVPGYQSSQVRLVRISDNIHRIGLSPVTTAQQQPASAVPPTLVPASSALRDASPQCVEPRDSHASVTHHCTFLPFCYAQS